jgi:ATP-dependent DNA ligase
MAMTSLCQLATDWRGEIPEGGLMAEQKIDGWRALRFPGVDGKVRLWTRNGMTIEGAAHILHRLELMEQAAGEPMVFDGEYQVEESLAATKAWCERGWRIGGEAGKFHVFDCLTVDEWRAGGSDAPLYQRKAWLRELFAASEEVDDGWTWREGSRGAPTPIAVHVLADGWSFDASDVLNEARRIWAAGGEGVMLKDAEAPYRRNRNVAWLKVKQGGPWCGLL